MCFLNTDSNSCQQWRIGFVAWAVMSSCHFIGGLVQAKSGKGFSGYYSASHSELVALASESATNIRIRTIASFCYEEHILRKAKISLEIPKKMYRKESIKYGIIQGFSLCLWNIAHAVALWYTTVLVDRGLVQQEPLLFNCCIRENICYGNNGASESEIIEVAREANIHEFVSNLPNGYSTFVGEKGSQLSGGQKQRIAIARTLLKKPAILLLMKQQVLLSLDAESERSVVKALKAINLKENSGSCSRTTQITVAHSLSTVINSDTIIVMDKGKLVEMGSHSTLIVEEGLYSRLCKLQRFEETSQG